MIRLILLFFIFPFCVLADPFSITITGQPQTVFYYPTDHCQRDLNPWQQGMLDFPDAPARAFIDNDNQIQLIATNSHGLYRSLGGRSLNDPFQRDCTPILTSDYKNIGKKSEPSQYQNQLWIWAVWADEATRGKNIYAFPCSKQGKLQLLSSANPLCPMNDIQGYDSKQMIHGTDQSQ